MPHGQLHSLAWNIGEGPQVDGPLPDAPFNEHPKIVYNLNGCHVFSGQNIGGQELIGSLDGWIVTSDIEVSQNFWSPFLFFLGFDDLIKLRK
jgi:hypothetical protein